MKKHLFFAFAAAAVLASCSSHDDFDNYSAGTPQAPVDDNSPQEILLGVGAQANVATRGTGTVGGDHNNIGDYGEGDTYNKWQKQRINVYMFNKYDGTTVPTAFTLATETEGGVDYIYDNALFMTPNGETSGAARHIDGDPNNTTDFKRSYYPMNGNFDFWAYRLDDANVHYGNINSYTYKTFGTAPVSVDEGYEEYKVNKVPMFSRTAVEETDVASGEWASADRDHTYPVYVKTTTTTGKVPNGAPTVTSGEDIATANITVPFLIDGSQDVMAASTELTAADADKLNGGTGEDPLLHESVELYYPEETFKTYARSLYSAKTARKGVQPNLKFQHLLTRFTFDAKQMADATNDGVGNDNEVVRIKKIEVKSKVSGEIVAKYINEDPDGTANIPTGLKYVIKSQMTINDGPVESLQLKKRPDTDQNKNLVDLTEGLEADEYIVLKAETVKKSGGGYYEVGKKATKADIEAGPQEGQSYTLDEDYKIITVNGIALNTDDYTAIGEALLVMPGEEKYVMDITVEQTVYGRETEAGAGVVTSKEVKTQTIKDLEIRANEVVGGTPSESEEQPTFKAGNSYNVKVMVYGLTKIEVKTTLEEWKDGGNINLDPDNQM